MIESPFLTIHKIVSEEADALTDLRIMIKDCRVLSDQERASLQSAADELELCRPFVVKAVADMKEVAQMLFACRERIAALESKLPPPPMFSMSLSATLGGPLIPTVPPGLPS